MKTLRLILILSIIMLVSPFVNLQAQGKRPGTPIYTTKKQCRMLDLKRKDADQYTAKRRRSKRAKSKVVQRAEYDVPITVPKNSGSFVRTNRR